MSMTDLAHRLGHQGLREAAEKGLNALASLRRMRDASKEQMGHAIQSLEVNSAAFAFGFARGYFSEPGKDLTVLGVPVDLASGLVGHAAGLFGGLGRYKEDAHNLSDGALASYFTTLGLKLGVEQREKHPATPGAATSGVGDSLAAQIAAARM